MSSKPAPAASFGKSREEVALEMCQLILDVEYGERKRHYTREEFFDTYRQCLQVVKGRSPKM